MMVFDRYTLINEDATMIKKPRKRCGYFLTRIEGLKTVGWHLKQYQWLKDVENHPEDLPFGMNEWQVLEREFKWAFVDYAAKERA